MTIIENIARYEAAVQARRQANARKTNLAKFTAECADWEQIVDFVTNNAGNKFWGDIHKQWQDWGRISPKVVEIVRERLTNDAARKAAYAERDARSEHIGSVGEKITVEATVTFQTAFDGEYGVVYVTGLRTDDENVIIHKGAQPSYETGEVVEGGSYYVSKKVKVTAPIAKGDRVLLKATVKAHGERNGAKQTIVTRPKVALIKVEG